MIAMMVMFRGTSIAIDHSAADPHGKSFLREAPYPGTHDDFLPLQHLGPSPRSGTVLWMRQAGTTWAAAPHSSPPNPHAQLSKMGKVVNCLECAKVYRNLEELEDLRDNDEVNIDWKSWLRRNNIREN